MDLDALAANLGALRRAAGGLEVHPVVKADAYGHGLLPVALRLQQEGADGLCVALLEEGLSLREGGVELPILVLSGLHAPGGQALLGAGLTPVVHDELGARALAEAAGTKPCRVHLKLDTGMARLGLPTSELPGFLDGLESMDNLLIEGVMTHLSSADTDPAVTRGQLERFDAALEMIVERGHQPKHVHAANSAGMYFGMPASHTMVRPGISLYGVPPAPGMGADLLPVMTLRSEILSVRALPSGAPVGYDETFRTSRPSRVATVAMGYADGLMRAASNRARVLVGGLACPVVGRVSMDLTTVDVTDVPQCMAGDEVVIIGRQGDAVLGAAELARACDTISYEVLTAISRRVPRYYE